jgi:hypothetical protein
MRIEVSGTISVEALQSAYEIVTSLQPEFGDMRPMPWRRRKWWSVRMPWVLLLCAVPLVCNGGYLLYQRMTAFSSWIEIGFTSVVTVLVVGVIPFVACSFLVFTQKMRWNGFLRRGITELYRKQPEWFQQSLRFDDSGFRVSSAAGEHREVKWAALSASHANADCILLIEVEDDLVEASQRWNTLNRPAMLYILPNKRFWPVQMGQRKTFDRIALFHVFPRELFTKAQYRELVTFLAQRFSAHVLPTFPSTEPWQKVPQTGILPSQNDDTTAHPADLRSEVDQSA